MSDLVRNTNCWFSHVKAQIIKCKMVNIVTTGQYSKHKSMRELINILSTVFCIQLWSDILA